MRMAILGGWSRQGDANPTREPQGRSKLVGRREREEALRTYGVLCGVLCGGYFGAFGSSIFPLSHWFSSICAAGSALALHIACQNHGANSEQVSPFHSTHWR